MRHLLCFLLVLFLSGQADAAPRADDPGLLPLLAQKTAKIPEAEKVRALFLRRGGGGWIIAGAGDPLTAVLKAAGAVIPGDATPEAAPLDEPASHLTLKILKNFEPQAVAVKTSERAALEAWLAAEAPDEACRVLSYPDALVERAAEFPGYFAAWLAGDLYAESFARADRLVLPQAIVAERSLKIDAPYVARARVVESRIFDFNHKTLVIEFKSPQKIISTGDGALAGATAVGNSFSPVPTWSLYHHLGYEGSQKALYGVLKLDPAQTSLLGTGADMDNLAVASRSFEDLTVTALVTAGVEGNALRAAKDEGRYFERPGTINIIVLTNRRLSPAALARSLITITEAKTAALWDMDIRSVQTPLINPATGAGTDDIIVVEGEGETLRYAGGHSKLGQLMSEAVYAGVQEALLSQNGKEPRRPVGERLTERGLPEYKELMKNPRWAGFMELALSLSDAQVRGQAADLSAFETLALAVAGEIAGHPVKIFLEPAPGGPLSGGAALPPVLETALKALEAGLAGRPAKPERSIK